MGTRTAQTASLLCLPVQTAWGWSAPACRGAGIARCCLPAESRELAVARACAGAEVALVRPGECAELDAAAEVLVRYFDGEPVSFALPLDLGEVPAFSALVLAECNRIGYGSTCQYGELAARAGRPRGARAVGQVMRRNPLAPLVPCHRVVGCGGRLTGFGGGVELKRRMLELEAASRVQQSGWGARSGVYWENLDQACPREVAAARGRTGERAAMSSGVGTTSTTCLEKSPYQTPRRKR